MSWRKPTAPERELLQALLAPDFPGAAELRVQAKACLVQPLDEEGSLGIQVPRGAPRAGSAAIPVDAHAADGDGVELDAFLHVEGGFLAELEVVKADGSPLRALPPGAAWAVVPLS